MIQDKTQTEGNNGTNEEKVHLEEGEVLQEPQQHQNHQLPTT
jgi:hypothetical protein